MIRATSIACFIAMFAIWLSGCSPLHHVENHTDILVVFLHKPEAETVRFASSLDAFTLHDAQRDNKGTWRVTVPEVDFFSYFYLVDGELFLPECQLRELDDFGAKNCLYQSASQKW